MSRNRKTEWAFFAILNSGDIWTILKKFMYANEKKSNIHNYRDGDTAAYYGYLELLNMAATIGALLAADHNGFPFFDLMIPLIDKHTLMTLIQVCRTFYQSLNKSPLFRQIQYSWRHVCVKCGEITGYVHNGRRFCDSHLPEGYLNHFFPFKYPCVCLSIPNIINDQLCAFCGKSFLTEKTNMFDRTNCRCYVQSKQYFTRYYDVTRIVLQDKRIVHVHSYCNMINGACPFSYYIRHGKNCDGNPKKCDRNSKKLKKKLHQ
jgi:hypothetical protein